MTIKHLYFGSTMPDLNRFFNPKSIAVIGASERELSLGGLVIKNLKAASYSQPVFAINLKDYKSVHGYPCFQYLREVKDVIDLALICVPPKAVLRVLRQVGRHNIKAAIVLNGGMSQQANFAAKDYEKITKLAAEMGIRLIGPNSLGVIAPHSQLNASYSHINVSPGSVAYLGHSSAVGLSLLDWASVRGIGFSHFLTLGASVDLRVSDVIDYLASDRRVKAILVHLELIRDANRLLTALRAASRSKNVLVIRTHEKDALPPGIIDFAKVDREFFTRAGVLQVDTIDELFSGLEILSRSRPLYFRNLAIVSNGVGTALLARQNLLSRGGKLAEVSELVATQLKTSTWHNAQTDGNPAVLSSEATGSDYLELLKQLEKGKNLGAIMVIHSPNPWSNSSDIADALLAYTKRSRRLVLTCFLGGQTIQDARKKFDEKGLLNFDSVNDAVSAYLTLAEHTEAQEKLKETPTSDSLDFVPDRDEAKRVIYQARRSKRTYLTWPESRTLLRAYGFKLVLSTFDTSFKKLMEHVTPRYYPAALRIVHETYSYPFAYRDVPAARWRGAKIELIDEAAVLNAHNELLAEKDRRLPNSLVLGWTVQPMRRKVDGMQFSLGITRDATYGPFVFFGEGGAHANMLSDRHVALAPLNTALAKQLIESTHGFQVLMERSDDVEHAMTYLIGHCVALSQMVIDNPRLAGVEVNLLFQDDEQPLVLGVAASIGPKMRPALNPYPAELEESVELKNGSTIFVRPIKGEDEPALAAFFSRFDADSLRLRFFYSRYKFEHLELATMSQIDYRREMVFVAVDRGLILGEMRLWWDINRNELEFAVMVSQEAQGTGLARILMEKTFRYARSINVRTIVADVLPENVAMLGLAKRFDFEIQRDDETIKVVKTLI